VNCDQRNGNRVMGKIVALCFLSLLLVVGCPTMNALAQQTPTAGKVTATVYPNPRSGGGLTCQTIAVPKLSEGQRTQNNTGASCDDICSSAGSSCMGVSTDQPVVSPVSICEDPYVSFSPSPTFCRCCSVKSR
jgi:hypothetical protein